MTSIRTLYASVLEPLARRIGLHDPVAALYWRLQFERGPSVVSHEVAGTTARFRATTVEEARRFRGLRDERPVIADLLGALGPSDVVFDVGANVGAYTCFVAQRLPPDQVVAFEPHPANVTGLRANLARNDVDATIEERALSDASGAGELAVQSHDAGAGEHALATGEAPARADGRGDGRGDDSGDGRNEHDARETMPIELAAGDDLVASGAVPPPTVLKVDVEGAELRVLEGLAETLEGPSVRRVYVEVHPDRLHEYGDREADVAAFLRERGFEVDRFADRGEEYFLRGCTA